MIYLEQHLRSLGLAGSPRVRFVWLDEPDGQALDDLRAEILDFFPGAQIEGEATGGPASADLAVVPLLEPFDFPLQDVLYRRLGDLDRLRFCLEAARHVMLYRTRWREVEIVAAGDLHRYLLRKRLERAVVGLLGRHRSLRALLAGAR